jgi:hypothetical protein
MQGLSFDGRRGRAGTEDSPGRTRRRRMTLIAGIMALLIVPVLVTQAGALTTVGAPTFTYVNDAQGADDQPGQKDLSAHAVATPAPGDIWVSWKWDITSLTGTNTGDACALFDSDVPANLKVDFIVCATIEGPNATQQAGSPRAYRCGDDKVDRCGSPVTPIAAPIGSACSTDATKTGSDPFHSGEKDTIAVCHVDLADFKVGGVAVPSAAHVNTCSYPSGPGSAPADCVLLPRDAFLQIKKIATPNTGSFPFKLNGTTVFTAAGTQDSPPIPIPSGVAQTVKEDVPLGWAIDTPAPSCAGAVGSGTSNGSFSVDTISGIKAASDNQIVCTFRDKQSTGAIKIVKQRTGDSSVKLKDAVFTISGVAGTFTTDDNGVACKDGLPFGTYTVTETTAPNGHTKASPDNQSTTISAASTCATTTNIKTFDNPLVLGTVNINKFKADGTTPLAGATFKLYNDLGTVGGTRQADTIDTITSPLKTCVSDANGDCDITNVPLGRYWIVETDAPAGYTPAADRTLNVTVGPSPGVGDTDSFDINNTATPGAINITKRGLNNALLTGAKFELFVKSGPVFIPLGDTNTGKFCTTASGVCSITGVQPGTYWLVETVTPNGYDTADPTEVIVPLGSDSGTGATVPVTINDPVVNGTVTINKTGYNDQTGDDDASLDGATFTLYTNVSPFTGGVGAGDTITAKSCQTVAGTCDITNVVPGRYWVVETVVPNGYDPAPTQEVIVGAGTVAAHVGDVDELDFHDAVVDGKVTVTKTDDAENALAGATFALYEDDGVTPVSPSVTCTTAGSPATCELGPVAPGDYVIVETATPNSHYEKAANQAVHIGIGLAPGVGANVPKTFVNVRKHRVVVLVCHEGTNTLFSRDVVVNGSTKQSLSGAGISGADQAALCATGGANFGDISGHGDVPATVKLGTLTP